MLNLTTISILLIIVTNTYFILWLSLTFTTLVKKQSIPTMKKREHFVTVLLPCRNEENVIADMLQHMKAQTYPNMEILVICHNCTDETFSIAKQTVQKLQLNAQVFELLTKKVGKGLGLQFGLDRARGDLIVYFDTDNYVPPKTIEELVNWIDRGYDGAQGKIMSKNPHRNWLTWIQNIEFLIYPAVYCGGKHRWHMNSGFAGTGVMVTKEALNKINGFNNVLIEDFDPVMRLTLNNFRVAYAENISVYDEKVPTIRALLRQRARWLSGQFQMWKIYTIRQKVSLLKRPVDCLYFYNPVCILALLSTFILNVSTWFFPIQFYALPWQLWIAECVVLNFMFTVLLWRQEKITVAQALYLPYALFVFSLHWYVALFRSLTIHGWADTKTPHGTSFVYGPRVISASVLPELEDPASPYTAALMRQIQIGIR